MGSDDLAGVDFPAGPDGRRSTSAVGRTVVADALRAADPARAERAEREANWRTGYLAHFRALVEAGLPAPETAAAVAAAGLDSLYLQLRAVGADGSESGLDTLLTAPARRPLATAAVTGTGRAATTLAVPYRGTLLQGDDLTRQLAAWAAAGTVEPSFAAAVGEVARHPEWLPLTGRTVAVLGAGAEMGPVSTLLGWGARVLAVDLPRPAIWERLLTAARDGAGTLLVPVAGASGAGAADSASLARTAGADLVSDVAAVADWLAAADGTEAGGGAGTAGGGVGGTAGGGVGGSLVLGNYAYADGAAHVRVAAAVDALTRRVQAQRAGVALAFLATPTDVFAVPAAAVAQADRAYATRSAASRLAGGSLRLMSGGRLLQRAYQPGADPGINDSLVAQQGPNYALAKRLQRWRAIVARRDGATVSINIAPPTRTRSVLKNRALAAAYAGAHRFGVEVFEPATCQVLMAALLVYDLQAGAAGGSAAGGSAAGGPVAGASGHTEAGGGGESHPWQDEAHAAAHGGLWRMAYAPRSALSLAAALGYLRPGR
jgi:hypothetical protein